MSEYLPDECEQVNTKLIMRACELMPYGFFIIDDADRFSWLNPASEVMFGLATDACVGREVIETLKPYELAEQIVVAVKRARESFENIEYEIEYTLPSSASFAACYTARSMGGGDSNLNSNVLVMIREETSGAKKLVLRTPLSASHAKEAELRARLKKIELRIATSERLAAVGKMAAGFVHEINTPLNTISGHLQLMQMDAEDDAQTAVITELQNEVERIERLASDMLSLARSSQKTGAEEFAPLEIAAVVNSVSEVTSAQMKLAGVKLEREIDDVGKIFGSEDKLRQVVLNILMNALQAMIDGGVVRIGLGARDVLDADLPERAKRLADLDEPDTKVLTEEAVRRNRAGEAPAWELGMKLAVLTIEDSGPGINAELLPHIFEPFVTRGKDGRGTGLGLAMVETIVRAHGGKVEASASEKLSGAKFQITFPLLD